MADTYALLVEKTTLAFRLEEQQRTNKVKLEPSACLVGQKPWCAHPYCHAIKVSQASIVSMHHMLPSSTRHYA